MGLAKLFELEFRRGRAASAPKTRVTAGPRTTLAEEMSAVGEEHDAPIMPHRLYGAVELDQKYPPIHAVDVEEEDEQLEDDLLRRGEEIAREIVANTKAFGRRKVEKSESPAEEPVGYVRAARLASTIGSSPASGATPMWGPGVGHKV